MRNHLHTLVQDEDGAYALEFALVAPVFMTLLAGTMEFGHVMFIDSIMQGVVQSAARDSGLDTGASVTEQAAIDQWVTNQIQSLHGGAVVTINRRSFLSYEEARTPTREPLVQDLNGNAQCDPGDRFEDINNNMTYDLDRTLAGQGGPRDRVIYEVNVVYPSLFAPLINGFNKARVSKNGSRANDIAKAGWDLTATVALANQPYAQQREPQGRTCVTLNSA